MNTANESTQLAPIPPFTEETATGKVRLAENAWNSRDPEKVALAYTVNSWWRTLQKLVRYWSTDCDWRKVEAKLNSYPQFVATIDGVDIHSIHVRSKHKNALPLIITHGWPGWLEKYLFE